MQRLEDWPERMARALMDARTRSFEWAAYDCAVFSASIIEAMTGEDLLAPFKGQYNDAASAQAVLKAAGHHSLYHYLVATFGTPIGALAARRGDVALGQGEDGPALGIVCGKEALFLGEARFADQSVKDGLIRIPKSEVRHFFKVG